jgi:hypothetical protein
MDKIIKLYENGEFIFDDKIPAFNTTTMVRLDSHQSLPIISFGTISMMLTKITYLENQMTNLKTLIEGLSTSFKAKDHRITKLTEYSRVCMMEANLRLPKFFKKIVWMLLKIP